MPYGLNHENHYCSSCRGYGCSCPDSPTRERVEYLCPGVPISKPRLRPGYTYASKTRELDDLPEQFSAVGPSMADYANRLYRPDGVAEINGERCYAFERTEFEPSMRGMPRFVFQPANRDDLWTPLHIRSGEAGIVILTPQGGKHADR